MKYFILSQDRRYTYVPRLLGLFYILDKNHVSLKYAHKIPKQTIVYVRDAEEYDLLDLLDMDLFLVSEEVKDVFLSYDKNILFGNIVLIDESKRTQMNYFLPILEDVPCVHPDSERLGGKVQKLVIDGSKTGGRSIFKADAGTLQRIVIVRLDVAEALLRRGLRGLAFKEAEVKGGVLQCRGNL
jgi:hypothetical protein